MLLTLVIFILIISVVTIRKLEWTKEDVIPVFVLSDERKESENSALNSYEHKILSMIAANQIVVTGDQTYKNESQSLYIRLLTQHLSENKVNLGEEQVNAVSELLLNLNNSIEINNEKDEEKLSLISRGVILSVSQQIYEQCGLILHYNIAGEIQQIREMDGNILYDSSINRVQSELKWSILIIVLLFCIILISVSIIITRHHQLFKKGGYNHGYKEKEFA